MNNQQNTGNSEITLVSNFSFNNKKYSKTQKTNYYIPLKPSAPGAYYRFRLLNFKSKDSARNFPFVEEYKHIIWEKDSAGKSKIKAEITCPVTKHAQWPGKDPYHECKICKFANSNFLTYKSSGWKNYEAGNKNRAFSRKFFAYIPVYVKYDPNSEQNIGQLKVITFTSKEDYNKFLSCIKNYHNPGQVFNTTAVDLYMRLESVEIPTKRADGSQYIWNKTTIAEIGFTNNAYEIPAITPELLKDFQFDQNYFKTVTPEEINDFYNTYCIELQSNDDIPTQPSNALNNNNDIPVVSNPVNQNKKNTNNTQIDNQDNLSDLDDFDLGDMF